MAAEPGRVAHLAGWLVADLMIVLMVVGLSTLERSESATPTTAGTTTTTTVTTSTTTTTIPDPGGPSTTVPLVVGLNTTPYCTVLENNDELAATLESELSSKGLEGRSAGLVLTFGISPDTGTGLSISRSINDELSSVEVFRESVRRSFWSSGGTSGSARLEIYFLAETNFVMPASDCFWITG